MIPRQCGPRHCRQVINLARRARGQQLAEENVVREIADVPNDTVNTRFNVISRMGGNVIA
jgi:hypothetical protein